MDKTKRGNTRREVLKVAAGGAALAATGGLIWPSSALAAPKLKLMNLGFVLGIHCPPTKGLVEELPKLGVELEMRRFKAMDWHNSIMPTLPPRDVAGRVTRWLPTLGT